MGIVFYGLAGEGRGHAARVRTLVDELQNEHTVRIYAPGDAYEFLEPVYRHSHVEVREIPGLRWQYDQFNRLNYPKSVLGMFQYLMELPLNVASVVRDMVRDKPDLVITDFDPLLPRAAQKAGIPFISINHQHFLTVSDLSSLPVNLKVKADIMAQTVPLFYSGQQETIVSSFFFPPLKGNQKDVTQVGVMLRNEVRQAVPEDGDHLVVYLRKFATDEVFTSLEQCGREVRIYGLGNQTSRGNLHFRPVSPEGFIEDLATGCGLVSTAGNQVVGEALYLGKPVLAMPEPGNDEQEINGHYLAESCSGISVTMDAMNRGTVAQFIRNIEYYKEHIDTSRMCGNDKALERINWHMNNQELIERKIAV